MSVVNIMCGSHHACVHPLDETVDQSNLREAAKDWLNLQYHHGTTSIKRPHELISLMESPPEAQDSGSKEILSRIQGSMLGLAIGDALGAHVEFRPHAYLRQHPVSDFQAGGTWGLEKGQVTIDHQPSLHGKMRL